MKNARQAWDLEQIARAVGFTTSRFLGRGRYDTRPFGTQAEALADARGDRRAIVYAITPEGWTIHIVNGDQIAKETTMETTKTYTAKNDAVRAAREALKGKHRDPMSGVHFRVAQLGEEWAWREIDLGTGEVALNGMLADGIDPNPQPALPPVTKVPPKGKAATPKAKASAKPAAPAKETRDQKRLRLIAEADARNKARGNAPKPPKAPRAPGAATGATPSKKAEALAAAQRGELPTPPDFSAETHKRFRKTLEQLIDFAKAGNLKELKGDKTEPKSSSRVAVCRYRDLAIVALEAKAKAAKAAAKLAA